ncbi:helix-turn-helix transcriptional regulator [Micromonospora sp. DR5-3]|uniref:winged helix-turn-helix transcriptional regulator n=1 Tax=unclassified Micromonospora TaxID=2617518 RepID=UPI0011D6B72E|nr:MULTISPECIES: helix-turn-helix domain-containing protein [unclassified Micromonospora]MCW3819224.1 helix-turn-helix transcriptional regulator [Micromonospora sp. DR5-3]TYC10813.1 helix-turn-helix transcriptional regulator [Micromonospora sp. MP36]
MSGAVEQLDDYTSDCRARVAFEVLANRWDSVVVYTIAAYGPMRPAALLARIGGISPKVLNDALRRLEYNGLVERRPYQQAPPRVDYALTEAGDALLEPMQMMGAWAIRYADAVLDAQERFEARRRPPGPDPLDITSQASNPLAGNERRLP